MKAQTQALLVLFGALSGCAGKQVQPSEPPVFTSQELVVEQGLTDFGLRFSAKGKGTRPATWVKASYEWVLEGQVIAQGEHALSLEAAVGNEVEFSLQHKGRYVNNAAELAAYSQKGGSLLAAVRGTLFVKQGESVLKVPFAKSREIRVPRLPSVKLQEVDAARFSEKESQATYYLGVFNPNPFPLYLKGLSYKVTVAEKELEKGMRGAGESIAASSTGVFEVQVAVNEATFGPEVVKLIKGRQLAWRVSGELTGELYQLPYELTGNIELRVSR